MEGLITKWIFAAATEDREISSEQKSRSSDFLRMHTSCGRDWPAAYWKRVVLRRKTGWTPSKRNRERL